MLLPRLLLHASPPPQLQAVLLPLLHVWPPPQLQAVLLPQLLLQVMLLLRLLYASPPPQLQAVLLPLLLASVCVDVCTIAINLSALGVLNA